MSDDGKIAIKSKSLTLWQNGVKLIISGTQMISRDLCAVDEDEEHRRAWREPVIKAPPKGKKFCSCCGDWVKREGFSPDERNRDGLQSHCRDCQNEHQRRIYRMMREAEGQTVREYRRAN